MGRIDVHPLLFLPVDAKGDDFRPEKTRAFQAHHE
jgi:hypothetical protein